MSPNDYELIDAGDGRRLERFGPVVVDRPAPGAVAARRTATAWQRADLRYDPGRGWSGPDGSAATASPWSVAIEGLSMELRPTSSGGLGVYPEHAANLGWLTDRVRERVADRAGRPNPAEALNLFAHTGLATLAMSRAGAAVAHVDAARTGIAWARQNAARNGLDAAAIRWLVDDAAAFVRREGRRGRMYDGLVLDPPSSGHGPAGRWELRRDLPALLEACWRILAPGAFVLLTTHTAGTDPAAIVSLLGTTSPWGPDWTTIDLAIEATSGARLALGWAFRLDGFSPGQAPRR